MLYTGHILLSHFVCLFKVLEHVSAGARKDMYSQKFSQENYYFDVSYAFSMNVPKYRRCYILLHVTQW